MFRKLLTDESHDELLLKIENATLIVMIASMLVVFPVYYFWPKIGRLIVIVFVIALIIAGSIRSIWIIRDVNRYKNTIYNDIFEEKERERYEKKKSKER